MISKTVLIISESEILSHNTHYNLIYLHKIRKSQEHNNDGGGNK